MKRVGHIVQHSWFHSVISVTFEINNNEKKELLSHLCILILYMQFILMNTII